MQVSHLSDTGATTVPPPFLSSAVVKTLLNKLRNKVRSFVIYRMCRVYSVNSKKLVSRVSKAQLPVPDSSDLHGKVVRLFHDDTLKSFFRRLCFSPDGQLLIVPSGIIENPNSDKNSNATFIFTRRMFNR